jgi:hypothetical protein
VVGHTVPGCVEGDGGDLWSDTPHQVASKAMGWMTWLEPISILGSVLEISTASQFKTATAEVKTEERILSVVGE